MAGEDRAIQQILDKIWELKSVGVNPFIIAHTKNRTKTDVITGEEYDILTSKMTNRNFDEIKTKLDILGTAYIDRSIKTKTETNIMGHAITTGKIEGEKRVIAFRDNNFSVECKSRFSQIVNNIEFDADLFVKSIEDAIKESYSRQHDAGDIDKDREVQAKEQKEAIENKAQEQDDSKFKEKVVERLTTELKDLSKEAQKQVVAVFKEYEVTVDMLKEYDKVDIDVYNKLLEVIEQ